MTLHLPRPHGRHRAVDRVRALRVENKQLANENDDLACALATAKTAISALQAERNEFERQLDQAGIDLSGLRLDNETAAAEIRRLQQQRINDAIEKARLRRELANARPRITAVPATAERPFAPGSVPQPHAA
ncbi:hypothetical protein ACIP69_18085 [Streptomyces hygroscopicus]|uniref:hypothetical protein n=1 Tax=Streptomyces hygroscopicus TaxID=1912 RepID=UPI00381D0680